MKTPEIIVTIGPACEEMLSELCGAGATVFRLNLSHGTPLWHREMIGKIRRLKNPPKIMLDTRGPEIRTGELLKPIFLKKGERITLVTNMTAQKPNNRLIYCTYPHIPRSVHPDDIVQFDNGRFSAKITTTHQSSVVAEMVSDGELRSARHINLPGVRINLPTLSKADIRDLHMAKELDVDFVALSFVREVRDIRQTREIVGDKVHIISKIECQEAVNRFRGIARESNGIMIARGDLAVETNIEELPMLQRKMLAETIKMPNTFSIVATGLLRSMVTEKTPHRAEVTDIATGVWEGADYLMLSDETAAGKYPVESVTVLRETAEKATRENI